MQNDFSRDLIDNIFYSSSCDYAGGGGGARSSGDGGSSVGHAGSILGAGKLCKIKKAIIFLTN